MGSNLLIIGATGNVGRPVWDRLCQRGEHPLAASRFPDRDHKVLGSDVNLRVFDFLDASTFPEAFAGIEKLFLIRPPQLSNVKRDLAPALIAARQAGVRHVVFLSLLGAEGNPVVPHRKMEILIDELGFERTFLRPSFFMQNLSTTHLVEIRDRNEIFVPAGNGKTSFIDVRDIAEVAIKVLTEEGHTGKGYELTGSEALSYEEIAAVLTEVLGRRIHYKHPGAIRFLLRKWQEGTPWAFAMVMTALYTVCRIGMAGTLTSEVATLLGREPITFRQFAQENRDLWIAGLNNDAHRAF